MEQDKKSALKLLIIMGAISLYCTTLQAKDWSLDEISKTGHYKKLDLTLEEMIEKQTNSQIESELPKLKALNLSESQIQDYREGVKFYRLTQPRYVQLKRKQMQFTKKDENLNLYYIDFILPPELKTAFKGHALVDKDGIVRMLDPYGSRFTLNPEAAKKFLEETKVKQ